MSRTALRVANDALDGLQGLARDGIGAEPEKRLRSLRDALLQLGASGASLWAIASVCGLREDLQRQLTAEPWRRCKASEEWRKAHAGWVGVVVEEEGDAGEAITETLSLPSALSPSLTRFLTGLSAAITAVGIHPEAPQQRRRRLRSIGGDDATSDRDVEADFAAHACTAVLEETVAAVVHCVREAVPVGSLCEAAVLQVPNFTLECAVCVALRCCCFSLFGSLSHAAAAAL